MESKRLKLISSSAIASILAILFVVTATITGELYSPFKNWLGELSGHHWVSKGYISIAIYLAASALFYFLPWQSQQRPRPILRALIVSAFLGFLAIFIFYTGHHLGWY
jgi:hypothetical protein